MEGRKKQMRKRMEGREDTDGIEFENVQMVWGIEEREEPNGIGNRRKGGYR